MKLNAASRVMIVGLGKTGLSCARYLQRQGIAFSVMDTRNNPPGVDEFRSEFPEAALYLGGLDQNRLAESDVLLMSPGVDLRLPEIRYAISQGAKISGDIDLFASSVSAPIIAITGSNAKTTVTSLVGEMALKAGFKVSVAGNIGTPVLDLLEGDEAELYVLELSSFQLETTDSLGAEVATVLNLSEDHMDRYDSFDKYRDAKLRIFKGCRQMVVNRDDAATKPEQISHARQYSFGLDNSADMDTLALTSKDGEEYLAFNGEALLAVRELRISGRHNIANALAALALGDAAGLPWPHMLQALREFSGLKHRCQWVAEKQGVNFYNDSKGTNVGAAVAAISGLGAEQNVILLAGGVGKGADFSGLAPAMSRHGKQAILFGEDAERIAIVLQKVVPTETTESLQDAVVKAQQQAGRGDIVLLSPACASFDMFASYEQRGDAFIDAVGGLQ